LLPIKPPAPPTFLITIVGLPGCAPAGAARRCALDIGRTAGRVVDDHGDRLALVELGEGIIRKGTGANMTRPAMPAFFAVIDWTSLGGSRRLISVDR
jgi:hypothetical protein